jgi:hypothetical protein
MASTNYLFFRRRKDNPHGEWEQFSNGGLRASSDAEATQMLQNAMKMPTIRMSWPAGLNPLDYDFKAEGWAPPGTAN